MSTAWTTAACVPSPSTAARSPCAGWVVATARSTTAAPTRAARSVRAASRTGGCAARGTGTTTTRSAVTHLRASPTRSPATRSSCVTTASTSSCRAGPPRCAPCPTRSSRRSWRGASPTSSAWSAIRTSDSPTLCAAPRGGARSPTSVSATKARRPLRRPPSASSPGGRRRASPSPDRAPRTCSPGCTTPRSTGRPSSRSRGRCPRRCSVAAPSRTSTSVRRSPTSRHSTA